MELENKSSSLRYRIDIIKGVVLRKTIIPFVLAATFVLIPGTGIAGDIAEKSDLILGGTGGSPAEAAKCKFNSKLNWGNNIFNFKEKKLTQRMVKFIDQYKKAGIYNFFMHGFAKGNMDIVKHEVIDGKKLKFFKYPYSFTPDSMYMQEKKKAIARELDALKNTELPADINMIFNPYRDEVYYNNAHLNYLFRCEIPPHMAYYSNSPVEKEAFKKATGLKFPKLTPSRLLKKNSKQNREYILFRYQTSAQAFAAWLKQIKETLPDLQTYITLNLPEVYGLERYPSGIALDMAKKYGFQPDYVSATAFQNSYDWRGPDTHYYPVEVLKHLRAAFPKSKTFIFTSQFVWRKDNSHYGNFVKYEEFPQSMEPHEVYGLNAMLVGHGANGVVPFAAGQFKRTKEIHQIALSWCYSFLKKISPWLNNAKPHARVALLYSRAGEDFWSLTNEDPSLSELADGSVSMRYMQCIQEANYVSYYQNVSKDKSRGFRAHKNVMHFLLKNNILFDLVYIDSLKPEELNKYESAIMPFPYSVSKNSLNSIKTFADNKQKKLIICEMLGEINEKGDRNEKPLLTDLLQLPNVYYINDSFNINPKGSSSSEIVKKLLTENSESLIITGNRNSKVEMSLLRKPEADIIMMMNWSNSPAKGTVKLPWLKDTSVSATRISLTQDGKIEQTTKEKLAGSVIKYNLKRYQLQAILVSKD